MIVTPDQPKNITANATTSVITTNGITDVAAMTTTTTGIGMTNSVSTGTKREEERTLVLSATMRSIPLTRMDTMTIATDKA